MKLFSKILLIIISAFVVLFIGLVCFLYFFQDEIKSSLIKQLNKQLVTEVKVRDIKLSALNKFPKVSITFTDVEIKGANGKSDHDLARIGKLFLTMDVIRFLKKDYRIDKVFIEKAKVYIEIDKNGNPNYIIWKPAKTQAEPIKFLLDKIKLTDVDLEYYNYQFQHHLTSFIDVMEFSGKFFSFNYIMKTKVKALVKSFKIKDIEYLKGNDITINTDVKIDNKNLIYVFKSADLTINKTTFKIEGNIKNDVNSHKQRIDLSLNAKRLTLDEIYSLLPSKAQNFLTKYSTEGTISCDGTIKGDYGNNDFPAINVKFSIKEGIFKNLKNNISIKQIKLDGQFTNGKDHSIESSSLHIKDFYALLDNKEIKGALSVENFNDPLLSLMFSTGQDLKQIQKIFEFKGIKEISGFVKMNIFFEGKINNIKTIILNSKMDGDITYQNANLSFDSLDIVMKNFNGKCIFNGNYVELSETHGDISGTFVRLSGKATNLIPYIFGDKKLTAGIDLYADKIDLNKIFNPRMCRNPNVGVAFAPFFLKNADITLNLSNDYITFGKFSATKVSGKVDITSNYIQLDSLSLNSNNGKILLRGRLSSYQVNQFKLDCVARLNDVDIKKLFVQFNNFGQQYITDKHLSGIADARLKINSTLNCNFKMDMSKLNVIADLTINNGELKDFEPIQKLMGFIKLKKMKDVFFDKIENTILIKDRMVIIPKMTLRSNAFNWTVSAEHSFDNDINYNFVINITRLLLGRNKQDSKDFVNAEADKKGGITLYVIMYGKASDPKFKFDRSVIKKNFNEGLKKQGRDLKDIFNPDSNQTNKPKNKKIKEGYKLEWDDK